MTLKVVHMTRMFYPCPEGCTHHPPIYPPSSGRDISIPLHTRSSLTSLEWSFWTDFFISGSVIGAFIRSSLTIDGRRPWRADAALSFICSLAQLYETNSSTRATVVEARHPKRKCCARYILANKLLRAFSCGGQSGSITGSIINQSISIKFGNSWSKIKCNKVKKSIDYLVFEAQNLRIHKL